MISFKIVRNQLDVQGYQKLRKTTSWAQLTDAQVEAALKRDLLSVTVVYEDQVVGMGRVIGDGAVYFYVQDLIILPEYQKRGLGKMVMKEIEAFLNQTPYSNKFVGLMAASGTESFYEQFGYHRREGNSPGMFKRL